MSRRVVLVGVAALLLLLAGSLVLLRPDDGELRLTARFTDTTGLYPGNQVTVLGVRVGTVDEVSPDGEYVDVTMRFPADTRIARGAGAAILQSSLVADRYVELTPAWAAGPVMGDGDTIPVARTASPVNIDDIVGAIDELVVALDGTTPQGKDIGDLIRVSADALDGRGGQIRDALVSTRAAMQTMSGKTGDLTAVTQNLDALVSALANRDTRIRRLQRNVSGATSLLASQRRELQETLSALLAVSGKVTAFVRDNKGALGSDLTKASRVVRILARNQASLTEMVDVGPLMAENIYRAWDPATGRLRIRLDMRDAGPFGFSFRQTLCRNLGLVGDCSRYTNQEGTGLLDPLLNLPGSAAPTDW